MTLPTCYTPPLVSHWDKSADDRLNYAPFLLYLFLPPCNRWNFQLSACLAYANALSDALYSLKNLPYTVSIITKDSTHTSKLPMSVTAHRGIDSQKPQSSIVCIILCGRYVAPFPLRPEAAMIFDMTPCTMVNIAIIRSRSQVTAAFASTKRINSFNACSGRLIYWKELN